MDRRIDALFAGAEQVHLAAEEQAEGRARIRDFLATHALSRPDASAISALRTAADRAPLKDYERAGIGARLISYMRFRRPDRQHDAMPDAAEGLYEQVGLMLASLSLRKLPAIAAFLLIVGAGGTGMAAAAADALPGDFLYPVKLAVVEHPYAHLRFAATARAEWEEVLAEKRLDEAERLAAEGRLTDEAREVLSREYAEHSERARTYGGVSVDPPDFETSLQGREAMLRGLVEERGEADVQLRVLLDRLEQAKKDTKKPHAVPVTGGTPDAAAVASAAASATRSDAAQDARRQLDAAHRRLEQVRMYLESVHDDLAAGTSDAAQQRLAQSAAVLAQGNARYDAGNYADADALGRKASLLAQEAKLLARADAELQVDLTEDIVK